MNFSVPLAFCGTLAGFSGRTRIVSCHSRPASRAAILHIDDVVTLGWLAVDGQAARQQHVEHWPATAILLPDASTQGWGIAVQERASELPRRRCRRGDDPTDRHIGSTRKESSVASPEYWRLRKLAADLASSALCLLMGLHCGDPGAPVPWAGERCRGSMGLRRAQAEQF